MARFKTLLVIAGFGLFIAACYAGVQYLDAQTEFMTAKRELLREITELDHKTEDKIASLWYEIARDLHHDDDYERGYLNASYNELLCAEERDMRRSTLVLGITSSARTKVWKQLHDQGQSRPTDEQVNAELAKDERYQRIQSIHDVGRTLFELSQDARLAESRDALEQVQANFETHSQPILALIK